MTGSILAIDVVDTLVVLSSLAASSIAHDLLGLVIASLAPASKTGSVSVFGLFDLVTAPARVRFSVISSWFSVSLAFFLDCCQSSLYGPLQLSDWLMIQPTPFGAHPMFSNLKSKDDS